MVTVNFCITVHLETRILLQPHCAKTPVFTLCLRCYILAPISLTPLPKKPKQLALISVTKCSTSLCLCNVCAPWE